MIYLLSMFLAHVVFGGPVKKRRRKRKRKQPSTAAGG